MPLLPPPTRLTSPSWRRRAAAALLALQALIAVSLAMEPRGEAQLGAHAEDRDSRHLLAHDEATCAVCAVRTTVAVAPPDAGALFMVVTRRLAALDLAPIALSTDPVPGNFARAPPVRI